MKAHVHYEAAFEDFLRARQIPYVAVDESKRALFRDARLKSFDFIVYSQGAANWLADVKGRRWGARPGATRPGWVNWATLADLEGLTQWEEVFGAGFRGLLVFAYWLASADTDPPAEIVHTYAGNRYVFCGVPADEYRLNARMRSPKWGTVNLPVCEFARRARPMAELLGV